VDNWVQSALKSPGSNPLRVRIPPSALTPKAGMIRGKSEEANASAAPSRPRHFSPLGKGVLTCSARRLKGPSILAPTLLTTHSVDWPLGTPAEDKDLILYETDHIPPGAEYVKEIIAWVDKYLGTVYR